MRFALIVLQSILLGWLMIKAGLSVEDNFPTVLVVLLVNGLLMSLYGALSYKKGTDDMANKVIIRLEDGLNNVLKRSNEKLIATNGKMPVPPPVTVKNEL